MGRAGGDSAGGGSGGAGGGAGATITGLCGAATGVGIGASGGVAQLTKSVLSITKAKALRPSVAPERLTCSDEIES
ncbi:MAG: hypothetical protein EAZ43_01290 [Betaproteobacteria bacterium]|nr:MAG: hypothetical protein EAZ43_01290 [Betaproteobacteria bacterium]